MAGVTEKEQFVSGHSGGPVYELILHLAVLALAFALVRASRMAHWTSELAVYAVALCLAMTVLADWLPMLLVVLVSAAMLLHHRLRAVGALGAADDPVRAVLSVYRGGMMLATCIAILAVDFPAFPRRLAKTETFGWSLMDLGVGSFLFSAGLVNRSAGSVARAVAESAVVLGLGVARYVVTTLVGYQQHVSEYGTHWNFFLTIGILLFAARAWRAASWPPGMALTVGTLVCAVAQWALISMPGAVDYVLNAPRVSWISHNREGLVSLAGFMAILLWGVEMGKLLRDERVGALWGVGAVYGIAAAVLHVALQPASRRLANAAYCCGVAWLNCWLLASLLVIHRMFPRRGHAKDMAMDAISHWQLPVFLLANVSTGLVNLSLNTLRCSNVAAFAIVLCYSMLIGGVAALVSK